MNRRLYEALSLAALAAMGASCSPASEYVPEKICGTYVDPSLTRPLLAPSSKWDEFDRVSRSEGITAPCLVLSQSHVVMRLRFSWDGHAADLMHLASDTGDVSRVSSPRYVTANSPTMLSGTDGAISQAPCKTKTGNYFTLTLQLPQIKLTDQSHRKDIEKFMRAYFPATVGTLGCR
ncbi:hypothetical protein [Streptomyces sp. NPDC059597]|uniref:hypothetical protein n=1 Tax=Streptomyces sp. NPDC059597 TaxID=3346879 RepID=UPI0036CCF85C